MMDPLRIDVTQREADSRIAGEHDAYPDHCPLCHVRVKFEERLNLLRDRCLFNYLVVEKAAVAQITCPSNKEELQYGQW